jgi:hypothetical protein
MYPHLIFIGNPFSHEHIAIIDNWIAENHQLLPGALTGLSFSNVLLLIRFSKYYQNVIWQLFHEPSDLILGGGMLTISKDGRYLDVVTTLIDFQGFGIYPVVLKKLYYELGPLRSDTHVRPNAQKVWVQLGAQFKEKRWALE